MWPLSKKWLKYFICSVGDCTPFYPTVISATDLRTHYNKKKNFKEEGLPNITFFKARLDLKDALNLRLQCFWQGVYKYDKCLVIFSRTWEWFTHKKEPLPREQPQNTGGAELILRKRNKISLSSCCFQQVNRSSGNIYHQTYCFAALGVGWG